MLLPSFAVITSPALSPAFAAGEPPTTVAIFAPPSRVARRGCRVGVLHLAAGDERVGDALRCVDRDREADAVVAAGVALDLRVDPDHLAAEVEQRAARVAVVDRGVRLDRAGDRVVVRRGDRAVDRADDAGRSWTRAGRTGCRSPRRSGRPARSSTCPERERMELRASVLDLDHGDVGRVVGADERRLCGLAVLERDLDRGRAVDDVRVRDDVAVVSITKPEPSADDWPPPGAKLARSSP